MDKLYNVGNALLYWVLIVALGPFLVLLALFASSVDKGTAVVCGMLGVAALVRVFFLPDCNYFDILTAVAYTFSTLFILFYHKYLAYPPTMSRS